MENKLRHNHIRSAFHQFMSIRMDEIGLSHLSSLQEYQSLMEECTQLFEHISNQVPAEIQELFSTYEEKVTLIQGLAESTMYEQGLKDGLQLHYIFEDVKI
ncbi:hypothetical protein QE450_001453 [Paenibacillus sp. SORGH_AS306]|uniref:hypothetical protein n=1 Tax=unclassified Paenibacillus TaxID=185978 RepID=UPI002783D4A0|nr:MULTISPECIES: hypothetical protein [unclassified Paenibacillus]MDQ1233955.1 hypothetical protein [Paenibacillus sp. SORGH_AS_0306]MDR6111000.1 hypothetical protein [Paenibacillus sp. SORGH_AS_0338]